MRKGAARSGPKLQWGSYIGYLPATLIVLSIYIFSMGWTIWISFTRSRVLPVNDFAGIAQYSRLFGDARWQVYVIDATALCNKKFSAKPFRQTAFRP